MKLDTFKRLFIDDSTISRFQDNVTNWAAQIELCPFLKGVQIDETINTTDTVINHKLQKEPEGFLVIDQDANANIWRVSSDSQTITLRASASVSAKIWVF